MTRTTCSVILPAAGRSSRMGEPKMLLRVGGVPLLRRIVETFRDGLGNDAEGLQWEIIVVTGYYRESIEKLLEDLPARPVFNPEHHLDMAVSLKVGFAAAAVPRDFYLTSPADHPGIRSATVARLVRAFDPANPDRILVPCCDGRRGHPVLLPGGAGARVTAAPPGWTLRDLVRGGAYPVIEVAVDDPGVYEDVDTPADLAAASLAPPPPPDESEMRDCPDRRPRK